MATADPSLAPVPERVHAPGPCFSAELSCRLRRLDLLLAGMVVVLAFLAASFPASNSDLFLHLASGRLLTEGGFRFGEDPFTFTTASVRWVNHSWLFDLLAYEVYRLPEVGGALLVAGKALLMALLAVLMLRLGRGPSTRRQKAESRRQDHDPLPSAFCLLPSAFWVPACCTGLAVLALSPRLLLQPVCCSYLCLGATLWLLEYPRRRQEDRSRAVPGWSLYRVWWLLPPLFMLWVNLDDWFLLGPLTVGLYWLGEALQQQGRQRLTVLGLVLLAGLAACLVNPYHVHAFTLPPSLGLSAADRVLAQDTPFRALFVSPWEIFYFHRGIGLSVAGLAYFPLLALGLVSFALTAGSLRWWRLLVWGTFALLSSYQARAIPFFAVVAGPITALNFRDLVVERAGTGWRRWSVAGRALTLLAGAVLVAAAVPGWLQAQPHFRRHLGWAVEPDSSLQQAALAIARWRDQGLVRPGAHWFNTSPEVVNYLAWFCPGERGFLDQRLSLFETAAADYVLIRRGLAAAEDESEEGWRAALERWHVDFVVVHANDLRTVEGTLSRLLADPDRWPVCHLKGRTAIFARKHPAPAPPDFDRLAFGPEEDEARAPPEAGGPGRDSGWRRWWGRARPVDADTALLHKLRFEALMPRYRQLQRQDAGPPAALYLALRAARRALAVDTDDARTYLLLGQVYIHLGRDTREGSRGRALPHAVRIRGTQSVAALEQALRLGPDLETEYRAHHLLADLYQAQSDLQPSVRHRREELRCLQALGTVPEDLLEQMEEEVKALERTVKEQEDHFELSATGKPLLQKVQLALHLGLIETALDLLVKARPEELLEPGSQGPALGAVLELDLMLRLGRLEEARAALTPDLAPELGTLRPPLDVPAYEWFRVQLAAASGDYREADHYLEEALARVAQDRELYGSLHMVGVVGPPQGKAEALGSTDLISLALAQLLLNQAPRAARIPWQPGTYPFRLGVPSWEAIEKLARRRLEQESDLWTLRGWLALEAGDNEQARACLDRALALDTGSGAKSLGLRSRGLIEVDLGWLKPNGR